MTEPAIPPPERIDFLLVEGFSALAFFSTVEPLRVANRLAAQPLFAWRLHSADGEPVAASSGMRVVVDAPLAALDPPGTLIVCAGFHPERGLGRAGLAALRRFGRGGGRFGAIDTGIVLLAQAGVAGPGPVAIHWEAESGFREAWPQIAVADALYTLSERLFSCAGGTAALDMMLERIARAHGLAFANAVAEQFIHDRIRPAGEGQRMAAGQRLAIRDPHLLRAIAAMEAHLDLPLRSADLARQAGVGVRRLERLFLAHLGVSPQRHYRRLRLERARVLLETTDLRVLDVALATGFDSASALTRDLRRAFGITATAARRGTRFARATKAE
ncbi:UNVERIFIED_ORG: AraC family carnitine catabolism transcriptional activator [Sphingomonas sp. R1F5B]